MVTRDSALHTLQEQENEPLILETQGWKIGKYMGTINTIAGEVEHFSHSAQEGSQ